MKVTRRTEIAMLKSFLIATGFLLMLSAPAAFAQTVSAPTPTTTPTETTPTKTENKSASSWFSSLGNNSAKATAHTAGLKGQHHAHLYRDRNSSHVASHASRTKNKRPQSVSADTTAKSSSKSWFGSH